MKIAKFSVLHVYLTTFLFDTDSEGDASQNANHFPPWR